MRVRYKFFAIYKLSGSNNTVVELKNKDVENAVDKIIRSYGINIDTIVNCCPVENELSQLFQQTYVNKQNSITHLKMRSEIVFVKQGIQNLVSVLNHQNVKRINSLTIEGGSLPFEAVKLLISCKYIEHLTLQDMHLGNGSSDKCCTFLLKNGKFKSLNLDATNLRDAKEIFKVLFENRHITAFSIANNELIFKKQAIQIDDYYIDNHQLEILNISNNPEIKDDGLEQLISWCAKLPELRALYVVDLGFELRNINLYKKLRDGFKKLSKLDISGNPIGERGLCMILQLEKLMYLKAETIRGGYLKINNCGKIQIGTTSWEGMSDIIKKFSHSNCEHWREQENIAVIISDNQEFELVEGAVVDRTNLSKIIIYVTPRLYEEIYQNIQVERIDKIVTNDFIIDTEIKDYFDFDIESMDKDAKQLFASFLFLKHLERIKEAALKNPSLTDVSISWCDGDKSKYEDMLKTLVFRNKMRHMICLANICLHHKKMSISPELYLKIAEYYDQGLEFEARCHLIYHNILKKEWSNVITSDMMPEELWQALRTQYPPKKSRFPI